MSEPRTDDAYLRHPVLDEAGAPHGFGTRGAEEPAGLVRPRQVHGTRVLRLRAAPAAPGVQEEADAIVTDVPGLVVGVVTADCLPVLVATPYGVAAIHAGWRGLAAGVVAAGLEALAELGGRDARKAVAVVGPHVGRGCYEVDEPVVRAMRARFGTAADAALEPARPGHFRLDLGALARSELERCGLARERIAVLARACTACDARRFHSYRRDGPRAGRLVHWIARVTASDRKRS